MHLLPRSRCGSQRSTRRLQRRGGRADKRLICVAAQNALEARRSGRHSGCSSVARTSACNAVHCVDGDHRATGGQGVRHSLRLRVSSGLRRRSGCGCSVRGPQRRSHVRIACNASGAVIRRPEDGHVVHVWIEGGKREAVRVRVREGRGSAGVQRRKQDCCRWRQQRREARRQDRYHCRRQHAERGRRARLVARCSGRQCAGRTRCTATATLSKGWSAGSSAWVRQNNAPVRHRGTQPLGRRNRHQVMRYGRRDDAVRALSRCEATTAVWSGVTASQRRHVDCSRCNACSGAVGGRRRHDARWRERRKQRMRRGRRRKQAASRSSMQ